MAKYFPVVWSFLFFIMIYLVLLSVAGPQVWVPAHGTIKELCSEYQDQAKNGIFFCTRENDPLLRPDGKVHGNVCSMCQAFFQAEAEEKKRAEAQARSKRASGNAPSYADLCHEYRQYMTNGKLPCTSNPTQGPEEIVHHTPCSMCQAFFQAEEEEKKEKESESRNKRQSENTESFEDK